MTARHFGTASDAGVSDPLVHDKPTRNVRASPVMANERSWVSAVRTPATFGYHARRFSLALSYVVRDHRHRQHRFAGPPPERAARTSRTIEAARGGRPAAARGSVSGHRRGRPGRGRLHREPDRREV